MEHVIIQGVDNNGADTFMCLSGERIPTTETDTSVYPFSHGVTLRLSPHSAARIGQEIITVSEAEILSDCELPTAPEATALPAVETPPATNGNTPNKQLTLFGDQQPDQLTIF